MFFSRSMAIDDEDQVGVIRTPNQAQPISDGQVRYIEKLKSGDAQAFDSLVLTYSHQVFGLLFRMTDNAEDARELTQETFLSALTAIKGFRGESGLKTWLFRIAINHSRNRHRWWKRRRRDVTVSLDDNVDGHERKFHEIIPDVSDNPEESALRHERERVLMSALRELPESFRECVILRDIQGLAYDEIAETLETNVGTVKSRIARGREELRKRLKDF